MKKILLKIFVSLQFTSCDSSFSEKKFLQNKGEKRFPHFYDFQLQKLCHLHFLKPLILGGNFTHEVSLPENFGLLSKIWI